MHILRSLVLIAALAGCAAQSKIVHPAGEYSNPPPEVRALPAPLPSGPPPPRVAVTMAFAPSLPTAMALSSKALLKSLDGSYLTLADAAVELAAVSPCLRQATGATSCIEGVLAAGNSAKGTVVILVSTVRQGMTTWTCFGRPVAPFDVGHQVIVWSQNEAPTVLNSAWPRGVQQAASSCITHAGRQSGW